MKKPVIRVTVENLVDGGAESVELPAGEYFLICTEPCHEAGVQVYPKSGTHIITIKGRTAASKRSEPPAAREDPISGEGNQDVVMEDDE